MRKLAKLWIGLCVVAIGLTSCYQDHSTFATIEVPVLGAVPGQAPPQAYFMEDFVFAPRLGFRIGYTEAGVPIYQPFTEEDYDSYEYVWLMSRTTSPFANPNTNMEVVGESFPLEIFMNADVTTGTLGYFLHLHLTHKETQMQHVVPFRVSVNMRGAVGAGLLVAHIQECGRSDIGFIASYHYCRTHWNGAMTAVFPDRVERNLFSERNNGRMIDGFVSQIVWAQRPERDGEVAVIVREQAYLSLDPPTMTVRAENEQVFALVPQYFRPQWIFTTYHSAQRHSYVVLMNNDELWSYHIEQPDMNRYTPLATDPTFTDYELQEGIVVPVIQGQFMRGLLFDKRHNRVVRLHAPPFPGHGEYRFGIRALRAPETGSLFDPRYDFAEYDCLYATFFHRDGTTRWTSIWIMRHRTTGRIMAYELEIEEAGLDYLVRGIASFDLTGLRSINDATKFLALGGTGRELFYVVDNRLYTVILTRGMPPMHNDNVWTAPQGETITHIMRHLHNDNTGFTTYSVNTRRELIPRTSGGGPGQLGGNLITVATYNAGTGEGAIYALPRSHAGMGRIAVGGNPFTGMQFVTRWGGFGRITAITQRQRG